MIFTAPQLVAGAAALLIPLIIHLLNRSRHRKIRWGAMHLLQKVVRTNQRRLRVQQLILLVLRCAFPVTLALALAGPVLTKFSFLPGDAPGRTVVIVDNSYSMSAAEPEAASSEATSSIALKSAVTAWEHVLETQAESTEIALVAIGSSPTLIEPAILDRRRLRKRFADNVHFDADPANIPAAFQLAEQILNETNRPRKTIIVISDFQDADWRQIPERTSALDEIAVAYFRVGDQRDGNVAVEHLQLPSIALTVGQQFDITASVRNFGPAITEVPVFLRINGDRVAASQVDLPADGTTEVTFQRTFDDRGSHLVQIEVDVVDPLPLDNRQAAAIDVPERLPVLVVDPTADAQVNFLQAALTPFELDGIGIEDLVRATFVTPEELAPVQLLGNRAVVLTNVASLNAKQLDALDEFVRDGGGLVVFPGPDSILQWFNDELFASLAPTVTWQAIVPSISESTKIIRRRSDHPVFSIFNETDNGDLATAEFNSWLDLRAGEETQVLSRFTDHPFVVESTRHRGRVLIASTDAANQWSDMAEHPFFVPLMQRLVVYAATNTVPPRNVAVGQPLVALLHPKTAGETLELTDAAGHTHSITAQTEGGVAKAVFPSAARPGPWTLSNPHGSSPIRFAVRSNRRESDLKLLSKAELGTLAGEFGATLVQSRSDLESFERASRFGMEFWRPVLVLALLLLFADVFLAQRFVLAASRS